MLGTFRPLVLNIRWKPKRVTIDNPAFRLHYRLTFAALCACAILVSSRQYFGEHIRCVGDVTKPEEVRVRETYCFITSTYTVVPGVGYRDLEVAHPGVRPITQEESKRRHAYYQWVPFVLFLQAVSFYVPHLLWRGWEGGTIKALVNGLEYAVLSLQDKDLSLSSYKIPSKSTRQKRISQICGAFIDRLHVNKLWAVKLVFCEVFNVVNISFQIFITDRFLGGQFLDLGLRVLNDTNEDWSYLNEVFPKVTKCKFPKYGPSGTIQIFDLLCVMALNIINEKIYVFLWFWFIIVAVISFLALLWRFVTFVFHAKSDSFNEWVFKLSNMGVVNPFGVATVTGKTHFSDWLFLCYLCDSMDPRVFADLFAQLAKELASDDTKLQGDETKPLNS